MSLVLFGIKNGHFYNEKVKTSKAIKKRKGFVLFILYVATNFHDISLHFWYLKNIFRVTYFFHQKYVAPIPKNM